MKVLKFGGTSVGTIESLSHVKRIVEGLSEQTIVVVSALGGITDKLIYTGQLACKGDQQFVEESQLIVKRHHDVSTSSILFSTNFSQFIKVSLSSENCHNVRLTSS